MKFTEEKLHKLAEDYARNQKSSYPNDYFGFINGFKKALELCAVSNWVAVKDAKFLKDGEEYLVSVNGYVTSDEWFNDGLGFRNHFKEDVMVMQMPEPPC